MLFSFYCQLLSCLGVEKIFLLEGIPYSIFSIPHFTANHSTFHCAIIVNYSIQLMLISFNFIETVSP